MVKSDCGSNDSAASDEQIKMILGLARSRGLNLWGVDNLCQKVAGVGVVYRLSKAQAAAVIGRLKEQAVLGHASGLQSS